MYFIVLELNTNNFEKQCYLIYHLINKTPRETLFYFLNKM